MILLHSTNKCKDHVCYCALRLSCRLSPVSPAGLFVATQALSCLLTLDGSAQLCPVDEVTSILRYVYILYVCPPLITPENKPTSLTGFNLLLQEVSHRLVRPAVCGPLLHPAVTQRGFTAPVPQCTAGDLQHPAQQSLLQHL